MAKPQRKSKRGTKKNTSKDPDRSLQILKIISSLAILVILVLGAGLLVDLFLKPVHEKDTVALKPESRQPVTRKKTPSAKKNKAPEPAPVLPETTVPKTPVYEVPAKGAPPVKPFTSLPQLPGQRPPLVAIIIDDIGYDRAIAEKLMALDAPLTLSMLPFGTFSRTILNQARSKGLEIMLHLPMEPHEYPNVKPGPGALLSSMSPDELIAQLNEDIDLFPGLRGVNNHMGSRISTSSAQMRQIFTILKKRGLYYVDSRTTSDTVAEASARLLQLPFADRDIFLDHNESEAFVRSQFNRLIQRAHKQGYAIAIGHPHDVTYKVLREYMPTLKSEVALVPASMVVQEVMVAEAAKTRAAR